MYQPYAMHLKRTFALALLLWALVWPAGASDMRKVVIQVDHNLGVAGFVLPGDRVDIHLMRRSTTDIVLRNVRLLDINSPTDNTAGELVSTSMVTVEVDTSSARKLARSARRGQLFLSLRAAGSPGDNPADEQLKRIEFLVPLKLEKGDGSFKSDLFEPMEEQIKFIPGHFGD